MLHLLLPGWLASAICMQAADGVPDRRSQAAGDSNCFLSLHLQHGSSVWCGCVLLLCERGAQPPAERSDDRSSVCRLQRPVLPGVCLCVCLTERGGTLHMLQPAAAGLAVCFDRRVGAWQSRGLREKLPGLMPCCCCCCCFCCALQISQAFKPEHEDVEYVQGKFMLRNLGLQVRRLGGLCWQQSYATGRGWRTHTQQSADPANDSLLCRTPLAWRGWVASSNQWSGQRVGADASPVALSLCVCLCRSTRTT